MKESIIFEDHWELSSWIPIANKDWIRKIKQSREIIVTGLGKKELSDRLGMKI